MLTDEDVRWLAALGAELASRRVAAGMPQREVAAMVGVVPSQIANYEAGQVDIPLSMVTRLAAVYGMPLSAFIAAAEERHAAGWQPKPRRRRIRSSYAG